MKMYKVFMGLAFLSAFVWALKKPGYDSVVAAIAAFAAFIGVLYLDNREQRQARQLQEVDAGGIGIQAGRDVKVGKVTQHK